MWKRADLKDKAKVALKKNYWKAVLVSFLLLLVTGGIGNSYSGISYTFDDSSSNYQYDKEDDQYIDNDDMSDEEWDDFQESVKENGLDKTISWNIEKLSAEDKDAIASIIVVAILVFIVVMLICVVFGIGFSALLVNPLIVGVRKFFIKDLNEEAQVKEITFGFDHNYKNIVKVVFFKDLYVFLWSLLFIIPGIVKAYQYRMVTYIMSENPTMDKDAALALSKEMMDGQKWNAFVLDLTFIGWRILGSLTFGILTILYVSPYQCLTNAALYEVLKKDKIEVVTETEVVVE